LSPEIHNEFSREKRITIPKIVTFEEDKDIFNKIAHLDNSSNKNSISSDHEDSFILHTKETNDQDKKETNQQDGKETNYQDGEENNNQNKSRGPLIGTMMTYYNMWD
jgi:asparagine synthetase A